MGIVTQRHGSVAEITLDWPDVRNALGPSEGAQLRQAIETADADETVGAVVISANGKAFCAGGDLPAIMALASDGPEAVRTTVYGEFQGIFRAIDTSRVPVITAVEGPAVGLGSDLALAGSATFMGTGAWLAQGWIRAGLIPATGGTRYVQRRGGQQCVARFLAADRVDGPTAESWNLAIFVDDARAAALAMAEKLASYPRKPLEAVIALSRIEDREAHLAVALDYQTGFLTDPSFADFAARLLGR